TWNSRRSNVRPLPRPEAMAIATAVAPSPADHRRLFTPPKPIGLARAFRHRMSSFGASVYGEGNDGAARTGPAATADVHAVRRGSAAITAGRRPATGRRATAEGPAAPAPGASGQGGRGSGHRRHPDHLRHREFRPGQGELRL